MMIQRLEPLSSFLLFVLIRLTFDLEPCISCSLTSAIGCDALEHAAILHGELLDLKRSIFRHKIPSSNKLCKNGKRMRELVSNNEGQQ